MNWIDKIPPFESQYSASTHVDAMDCVEESFCHIVYMLTGIRYSPRALAYLTVVNPTGSSCTDCINTANRVGLIPYDLWPSPETFTWESYYEPIPQSVLDQADYYDFRLIPADLNKSPIWTALMFNNGVRHLVARINDTQYFDSELGGPVKIINGFIDWQFSIQLTPKKVNHKMQFKTQNYKGELRIVLEADDIQTWDALCKVYGIDQSKPVDETVDK